MIDLQTLLTYLTLISVPVGVFYHIMTLRNQSRTRQAQLFMQIYNRMDEDWMVAWHDLYNKELNSFEDYWEHYNPETNRENYRSLMKLATYFEGIGVMLKEGLLDIRPVALIVGAPARYFWEKLLPAVEGVRAHYGSKRVWDEQEYLYNELVKYIEKHPELRDNP